MMRRMWRAEERRGEEKRGRCCSSGVSLSLPDQERCILLLCTKRRKRWEYMRFDYIAFSRVFSPELLFACVDTLQ